MRRISIAALLCLLCLGALPAASQDSAPLKTVILGFDGADADLASQWMDEGELPNLARLRDQGSFSPLKVTIPSQTPVSWSTFSTGLSPGRHGIIDFLRRDPATYQPSFGSTDKKTVPFLWGDDTPMIVGFGAAVVLALLLFVILKLCRLKTAVAGIAALVVGIGGGVGLASAAAKLLPVSVPQGVSYQQGATFWEVLGDAGLRTRVIRMPVTFPPEPYEHGELIAGLGTPDLSARIGKPFYFTSELFFSPRNGGDFSLEVVELYDNRGELKTEIQGPPNELFPDQSDYIFLPMTLNVAEDRSSLGIEVSGQSLSLAPGEWSDWVQFSFPFNSLIKLDGIGRFKLLSLDPEVRLYLSPIQFDPLKLPPMVDISTPRDFAPELAERFGRYKTIGWGIDTWSLADGTIDEAVFMEDVKYTLTRNEEMLQGMLADDDWDLLMYYFEFTDRVQHMMYRFFDPEHPMHEADKAEQWAGTILDSYKDMDRIVGETMAQMPADARLFVVSDHGFSSFRRGMNYNTWLVENGYMVLEGQRERKNLADLFDRQGEFLTNVVWEETQAYALGLGQIYINLEGREAEGFVKPEDYDRVVAEIKAGLEAYIDEETGEHPVAHVFTRDEAYGGVYDPAHVPDMVPSNNDGYRVGWQDSLGGFGTAVVEDNDRVWSGDHCSVYPPLVEGIFFTNQPLGTDRQPYMGDIMPTLLDLYGVEPPVRLDGESLM